MLKRWYVVQSYSGYEKYVKNKIKEKIKLHGLESLFGRILVPTEEVVEIKKGQKRRSERKYFPGYILIEMILEEQSWQLVRSVPRVSRFVGINSDYPTPIKEQEAKKNSAFNEKRGIVITKTQQNFSSRTGCSCSRRPFYRFYRCC
jgi:transcriptional antiterminator NusG